MSRYDYTYTLGTNKEGFLKEIAQALGAADKEISKTNLTVKLLCSEKELKQQLDKLKGLNPEILTTITLDVSRDGLKQDVDLMTKVIRQEFKGNKSISQAIQQQIKAGLTGSDLKSTLQDMLNEVYGDGTKVNAKNVRKLVEDVQKNLNKLDFSKSDTSLEAYEQITNLIEQYTKLSNLLSNKSAIKKEGLSTILDPKVLGFDFSEFQKAGDDFFQRSGDYINDHIQTLQTSIVKKYEQSAQTLYSNLKTFLMSNGNPIVAAFSINDAKNRSDQLKSQVQQATDEISKAMQEAQADISKYSNKGLEGLSESQASKLYTAVEVYKQLGGSMESVYDSMNTKAREWLKTELDATEDIRLTYTDRAKQITTPLLNELSASEGELKAVSKFITEMQDHIQQKVQEQAQLETAKVEIEPVISDPAAFIAKIEEQLVNQAVKVIIEPTIESVAKFEQLLQQQLPNEFINIQLKIDEKSAEVPITPTISDPAAFAQKVNEIIAGYPAGINIDPIVQDIVAFQEDIKKQVGIIPISVSPTVDSAAKENLKETTALDFSGILTDLDNLKSKVIDFKKEIDTLQESAKNALTTTSSLFEQFSAQPTSDSGKITSVIESLKALSGTVNQDIDVEKTGHFVQALNEIGKLQVNPNIDLSNFKLGKLNSYLEKSEQLVHLGAALESLAAGLGSLNISLTGANFEALKGVSISDKTIENLPKFAAGITQLKDELDKFSSSATGVLSSISQIVSKAQSLEYLYKLSTAPNSNAQSNIIGNGLMSAFDKSAISSIQHPAGSTDEVAALAKEYQWLTSQAKAYFTLASKYAKGTISSEDSLKLTQLERAMTGAIQRMAQFQETDQSLVTAQTDLQDALNKCGTAVESGLVNNLTKALTQIDTAENKALGFSNSIQEVKDKVVEIQRVFSTGGLIPTSEIEKAEGTLKKALSDVKQLKQDISEAKKAQENEIKNSYKNIFGNYGNTALGKADKGVVTDEVEIQKLVNEYNYLNKALSEYIQLMGKEAANPDKSADRTAKIAALTNAYTDFIARADAGVDTESRLAKASGDLSNALTNAGKTLSSDLHKKLQSYIDKLGKAEDGTTKYSETIRKLQEVQQKLTAFQNTKATNVSQIKAIFDEYQVGADVYSEALAKIKTAQKEVLESQKAQLSLNIEKWLQDNTKAAAKYETELRQLQKDIQKVSTAEELDEIRTKVLKFEESAEKAKLTGSTFADTLKQKFKELGTYLMSFASFYHVVNVLKQGISIAHEYDDAFTEMRKVTDASTSSLKEFQKESFQLANQVGTTAEQLQQSTADWLRLGESFEEAKKSAQDANVLLNVSEFEDINSATESLTAMSQAYQELDKMEIIDKLNNIGNNFNIATNDLAESLQRSAATLKVTGNTIDEAIALTVAGNSILQDPLSVGAGLKTISLRIQGTEAAKQELEELGEETENVIHTTAKLQETIKECTAVASNGFKGVDILDDNGNFLSTYEILSKIAEVYQEIVETDKQAQTNRASMLVEQLAGKNRANIAASILQSPELLKEVYEEVQKSTGSAEQELNSYLDSISGKLTTLKNTWQELWFNFIDSSTVKGVVDVLNDLAKILEKITTFAKPLGTISALAGGILSALGRGKLIKLYNAFFYKVA